MLSKARLLAAGAFARPPRAHDILFREVGLDVVWPLFVTLTVIGALLFTGSLKRLRKTISAMT